MALPVLPKDPPTTTVQPTVEKMVDWYNVYYRAEEPANIAVAPKLGSLEQMYAYF